MNQLRRVMCVEDDADIRLILAFSLGTVGGYEVLCCAGGREAVAQVPVFRPDLVLLDVMMPDLSGPETLLALRQLPQMQGVGYIAVVRDRKAAAGKVGKQRLDIAQAGPAGGRIAHVA